jgi:hypothetical protein
MHDGRQTKDSGSAEAWQQHEKNVAAAIGGSTEAQAGQRTQALREVTEAREQWRTEQDAQIADIDNKAGIRYVQARTDIEQQRTETDDKVKKRTEEDNGKIDKARTKGEADARTKRNEGKQESGSWLSRATSWVKDQFNKVVTAIKTVFAAARQAVTNIINEFKKAAFALIDAARNAIVGIINVAADTLIALGDIALAAFPGLRDKWRNFIDDKRDKAIDKVNEYADKLKEKVGQLLDFLASALIALLDLYEKALLAAVEFVQGVVVGALELANKLVELAGQFTALIGDIAPDPIGWLGKLGAAAKEGTQKFLWDALKSEVKRWFNNKLESVLGLGKMVIDILIKGCMSIAQIGRMAWEAVVAALPMVIIGLIIEKVVSLIVPAAGAIMTIIQGLIAAWGAISSIIRAFKTFFAFLKAVNAGGVQAACLFAMAVATGAVALLDFITEFLLIRLGRALKKVGDKLKKLAKKITDKLRRPPRRPGGRPGAPGPRRPREPAHQGTRDVPERGPAGPMRPGPQRPVRPRARPEPDRPRRPDARPEPRSPRRSDARSEPRKPAHPKASPETGHPRRPAAHPEPGHPRRPGARPEPHRPERKRPEPRRPRRPESKDIRLARIVARIRPKITLLLRRGLRISVFRAVLAGMKAWYRLTGLAAVGFPSFETIARLNPQRSAGEGEYKNLNVPQGPAEPAREPAQALADERTENPYGVRRGWPTDPETGQPLTRRDLKFLGWRRRQVQWWMRGEAPLGMTPELYRRWRLSLLDALEREGISPGDVDVRLLGSAGEGFSGPHKPLWSDEELAHRPRALARLREWLGEDRNRLRRRPFDVGRRFGVGKALGGEPSDYDTNISSDKLVEKARALWEAKGGPGQFLSGDHEYVNKRIAQEAFPHLTAWRLDWTKRLGREVSHAIFPSGGPKDISDKGFHVHFRESDWIVHRPGGS